MNNVKHFLLLVAALIFLSACSSQMQDVKISSVAAPNVPFAEFKTYKWVGVMSVLHDPDNRFSSREMDVFAEIKWLIDREMRDRGFVQVLEDRAADLGLVFAVAVDMEMFGEIDDPNSEDIKIEEIAQGALVVSAVEPDTLFAIWLGTIEATVLENPTFETSRKRLDYSIAKLFKEFPK